MVLELTKEPAQTAETVVCPTSAISGAATAARACRRIPIIHSPVAVATAIVTASHMSVATAISTAARMWTWRIWPNCWATTARPVNGARNHRQRVNSTRSRSTVLNRLACLGAHCLRRQGMCGRVRGARLVRTLVRSRPEFLVLWSTVLSARVPDRTAIGAQYGVLACYAGYL